MENLHVEERLTRSDFAKFDVAEAYDREVEHYPTYAAQDLGKLKAIEWAISRLNASSKESQNENPLFCIDVGCAHGRPTIEMLADQGWEVLGIDLSPKMLQLARSLNMPNTRFEIADVKTWEPPVERRNGGVDCITCFYVLNHIALDDIDYVIARISTWLRVQGVLIMATVLTCNGWVQFERSKAPLSCLTMQEMKEILERNDLEVVEAKEEVWQSKGRPDRKPRTHNFFYAQKK